MKLTRLVRIFLVLGLAASLQASPAGALTLAACTHYVATTGSNTNPGTLAAPWKTIQKAANTVKAGNVVCVRAGIYAEAVSINVSG